ncbi:hypothetical protein PENTCL1PPCAC_2165, partial [Pristionchus entomophagus]
QNIKVYASDNGKSDGEIGRDSYTVGDGIARSTEAIDLLQLASLSRRALMAFASGNDLIPREECGISLALGNGIARSRETLNLNDLAYLSDGASLAIASRRSRRDEGNQSQRLKYETVHLAKEMGHNTTSFIRGCRSDSAN